MLRTTRLVAISGAILLAGAVAASPQENKTVQIHVHFKSYYERVRPGHAAGVSEEDFTIRLSGRSDVDEAVTTSNALATQSWNFSNTLGGGRWRVLASNKLQKVIPHKQSVKTITITVSGNRCSASWSETLLPGYSEYYFYSVGIHDNAYYRQARMLSSTCEIGDS